MTARLTRERMLDALEAQVGLVRYALRGDAADPAARVTGCADWDLRDLVAHLGAVNGWAAATVRDGNPAERTRGIGALLDSAPAADEGAAALADWYEGIAGDMLTTFEEADPAAPVWTFAGPGEAAFWLRRQLHETAVHRWDVEEALGVPAATTPLPEDVAVDTVDEFCTAMRPLMAAATGASPVSLRLRAVLHAPERLATGAEPVGATAPGSDLEWVIPGADGAPEAEVAGPPETLALLLWGRVRADAPDLDVSGDRGALDAALEAGLST